MKFKDAGSALLFTHEDDVDPNFYYFAGISKASRLTAFMAIGKGKPVVFSNPLEYDAVKKFKNFRAVRVEKKEQLEMALRKSSGKKIEINCDYVSVNSMKRLKSMLKGRKFIDVSKQLREMRSVKSQEEIRKIREACKITSGLFSHVESVARVGKTEIEIVNEIEAEAKRLGAEGMAFPPIIASGKNSAVPHHIPGRTRLAEGILLADIGVVYEGYCSDLTRTYYLGEPTAIHKRMYAVISNARKAALKIANAGTPSKRIFEAANETIKKNYGCDMIHSLGHGLGIEVHETPSVSLKSKETLKAGMCITIEPGYYKEGFGGVRIEDDIVVKKRKPKMLSKAPEKLVSL